MGRLSARLTKTGILIVAGGLCWFGAKLAADYIENSTLKTVQATLTDSQQDWVAVRTNGLQILLSGIAPSEADRFRASVAVGDVTDPTRIVDEMSVAESSAIDPPDFVIELLRNDQGISLIGMVPASTDRRALIDMLTRETAAPQITDLLESADYPQPENWEAAVEFGVEAVQMASSAKISIMPGAVAISALAGSPEEKARLLGELSKAVPPGVTMSADISAPRPVIAPFTLRFVIDENGAKLATCAADSQAESTQIIEAATKAGVGGKPACTLALGSPSSDWAKASVAAIEAVAVLKQGAVTISDADIFLYAPSVVERALFNQVVGTLKDSLPAVFSVQAEQERPTGPKNGPAEFIATLTADKKLSMKGEVADQQMHDAIDSFAQARFASVQDKLVSDNTVPDGWTVKIIAGIEAIGMLEHGRLKVTPEAIELTGTSGSEDMTKRVASELARRLGPGARYHLSIRYDRRLDPQVNLPDGNECVSRLNIIMAEAAIGFEPGSYKIAGDPTETLSRLAAAMEDCSDFRIEAGGHTDSQGSGSLNADLSRQRAEALVRAMTDAGINTVNLTSKGYGESQPIADNDTEEGREENRRIEFVLLSETPTHAEPLPAPETADGITGAAAPPEAQPVEESAAEAPASSDDSQSAGESVNPAEQVSDTGIEVAPPDPPGESVQQPPLKPAPPATDETPDDSEAQADEPL